MDGVSDLASLMRTTVGYLGRRGGGSSDCVRCWLNAISRSRSSKMKTTKSDGRTVVVGPSGVCGLCSRIAPKWRAV